MGTWASTHDSGNARGMGTDSGAIWEEKLRGPAGGLNKIRCGGVGKKVRLRERLESRMSFSFQI